MFASKIDNLYNNIKYRIRNSVIDRPRVVGPDYGAIYVHKYDK